MAGVRLQGLAERAEAAAGLDDPGSWLADRVGRVVRPGPVKDALSGTWLGHPLHPILTDVPIGAWTSATVLDLVGGEDGRRAARTLVGVGILAALPTAVAGASDYADTQGPVRRVGVLHAALNATALVLFAASWLARGRGRHGSGRALSLTGTAAVAAGGFFGGHLSFGRGTGVDTTAFDAGPTEWTSLVAEDEVGKGPVKADAAGTGVLLVRRSGQVLALASRCTHRGGPLEEGDINDGCVVCPWHGSAFRLDDGEVITGPAASRQPVFENRVRDGRIEVRRAGP